MPASIRCETRADPYTCCAASEFLDHLVVDTSLHKYTRPQLCPHRKTDVTVGRLLNRSSQTPTCAGGALSHREPPLECREAERQLRREAVQRSHEQKLLDSADGQQTRRGRRSDHSFRQPECRGSRTLPVHSCAAIASSSFSIHRLGPSGAGAGHRRRSRQHRASNSRSPSVGDVGRPEGIPVAPRCRSQ